VGAISAAAGAAMFTIVRDGAMELRAEVSEQDLLQLAPGQPVTMPTTNGREPLTGSVRLVEPSIDIATRLGTVRIAIDEPSQVVQGMFLGAEIVVADAEGLIVPLTAISMAHDSPTVMRVRDGVVERIAVATGIRDGALVGVTDGLAPGDLVVTKAAAFVRDGDRVSPVSEEPIKTFDHALNNAAASGTDVTGTVTLATNGRN
jgi:HlyD family secretion protein